MISLMAFSYRYYIRTYRYIAPLLIYGLVLYFMYSVVPNPTMPSYSLTSSLLFIISVWLGFGYIDVEDETQQLISALHMGNTTKYYCSKLFVMVILTSVMSVVTTLYPILFNKFISQPTVTEGMIALLSHILLALLGMTISFLFTKKLMSKLSYAIIGLFLVVSISLAGAGIEDSLPSSLKFVSWVVPPLSPIMNALNNYETASGSNIVLSLLAPALYSIILVWIFLQLMKRRLF